MHRQTGPDLFSDPTDPANVAGLTPKDLLAGWRQDQLFSPAPAPTEAAPSTDTKKRSRTP